MFLMLSAAIAAALFPSTVAVAPAHPASCAVNSQPARIVRAFAPQYPLIAKLEGLTGTSVIRVDLAETGDVAGTYVVVSSGSTILDRAAMHAAQSIKYAPEIKSCAPASGSYAVEIEFAD